MGLKDKQGEAVVRRVSRRRGEDEGGGAAWKIAFADFCLALACLFMVLWVISARNQERIEQALHTMGGNSLDEGSGRQSVTIGTNPTGSMIDRQPVPSNGEPSLKRQKEAADSSGGELQLPRTRFESREELQELAQVLMQLSAQVGLSGNLRTVVTPYGLRVMLHDTDRQGMFELGSAEPGSALQAMLRKLGPLFSKLENQMLVVGHTDALQYADRGGAAYSNWSLSVERAMAARTRLLDSGMNRESLLQVVGMADRAPLEPADPRAAVNRRIELLILTTGQAKAIAQMFGAADAGGAMKAHEVDAALPSRSTLQALRDKLFPKPAGKGH
jgi:chemotaxis protein MotB